MITDVDLVNALTEITPAIDDDYGGVSMDAFVMNDFLRLYIVELGGRRLCSIGAAVSQYSGDAMRELRPHDPFRVVGEGNLL